MSDLLTANSTVNLMLNQKMRKALRLRVAYAIENTNTGSNEAIATNAAVMAVNVLVELTGLDAHYWTEDI